MLFRSKLPRISIEELISRRIEECLADYDGNRTHAARELQISVRTLQRRIQIMEQRKEREQESA